MESTVYTEHPDPAKKGVNINRDKYEVIHEAIVETMKGAGPVSLKAMTTGVKNKLAGTFDGSVGWYVTTVKLDMESKGELVCDRTKSPHEHRLVG